MCKACIIVVSISSNRIKINNRDGNPIINTDTFLIKKKEESINHPRCIYIEIE